MILRPESDTVFLAFLGFLTVVLSIGGVTDIQLIVGIRHNNHAAIVSKGMAKSNLFKHFFRDKLVQ